MIEGFYGTPWTWAERREVADAIADAGMDTFVYAPKDDQLHRAEWRTPYPDDELARFEEFAAEASTRLGFGISPGLSIDPDSRSDRSALVAKIEQVTEVGVDLVALALDDLPFHDGQGAQHGGLTAWLREELAPDIELVVVPNHYTGVQTSAYLEGFAPAVPPEVAIAWTGPTVVCDEITVADADAWRDITGHPRCCGTTCP